MDNPIEKKIHTASGAQPTVRFIGFWLRVLAHVIDSLLVIAATLPPLLMIYGNSYLIGAHTWGVWNILIGYVLPIAAVIVFWRYKSATPGKMVIGAQVVDEKTGLAPSYGQCVIRYVGYIVSFVGLCLGFIWVAFDKKKRAWHDLMAGTVVISKKSKALADKSKKHQE